MRMQAAHGKEVSTPATMPMISAAQSIIFTAVIALALRRKNSHAKEAAVAVRLRRLPREILYIV